MTAITHLSPEFVEFVPNELDDGVLYISVEYKTASHLCACGCGRRVVTPLSPHDWRFEYDGETASLNPSIGNWAFDCKSHYIVHRGIVRWAKPWTQDRIDRGRRRDLETKLELELELEERRTTIPTGDAGPESRPPAWWRRLLSLHRSQ